MLNRRLVVLFVLFVMGFAILATRLGYLQVTQARQWQDDMRDSLRYNVRIETARGAILDRNGIPLAFDQASYYLAMDYRAMNLEDRWLLRAALDRLKDEKFPDKATRLRRIAETKKQIAEEIDAIPAAVARTCNVSEEEVLARFQNTRQKIRDMRALIWSNSRTAGTDPDADFRRRLKPEDIAHTIIPHISEETAFYFKTHAEEFPGLCVMDARRRVYPYKEVACQLVGTLRKVDAESQRNKPYHEPSESTDNAQDGLAGYRDEDLVGESGVEAKFESLLRGVRGCRIIELDPASDENTPAEEDETASTPDRYFKPQAGKDVQLTLDISLQKDIEAALYDPTQRLTRGDDGKDHFVALVVLSVDGQVLAMVSTPGYDPNDIDNLRKDLITDEFRRPLSNRALQPYQPGSTVKPLLALAALTENVVTTETTINCNGYFFPGRPGIFKCDAHFGHGPMQLTEAISHSCNVYFYTVGLRLGVDRLATWYGNYGLGHETGFELPDANGLIPKAQATDEADVANHDAMLFGIGQGRLMTTSLQMANAYATLLGGGKFISPRLIAGSPVSSKQSFHVSATHLATIKDAMRKVVTSGTARDTFRSIRLPVGGKTGSATTFRPAFDDEGHPVFDPEKPIKNADGSPKLGPDKKPLFGRAAEQGTDAWFVGYAPADNPKFVVAAVMEFGGHGGAFAAPLVKETLLQLERHNYLKRLDVPDEPEMKR